MQDERLAHLDRALASGAEGCVFESRIPQFLYKGCAKGIGFKFLCLSYANAFCTVFFLWAHEPIKKSRTETLPGLKLVFVLFCVGRFASRSSSFLKFFQKFQSSCPYRCYISVVCSNLSQCLNHRCFVFYCVRKFFVCHNYF